MYLADTDTVALLETALHDIPRVGGGSVSIAVDLAPRLIAHVTAPRAIRVIDLRDDALDLLGLARDQLVATSPAHYPCTREWAAAFRGHVVGGQRTSGLIWESRVAEIAGNRSPVLADVSSEVCVVFGEDMPTDATSWGARVRYDDLSSGAGLAHVEEIVTLLGATIS